MLLPRRVVKNVKSHLIYTIALIVIVIVGLPFIQTLFSVLWKGNVVLSSIAIFILVGLFYALPEKSRLDCDGEQMRQFRKDVPDGTYDMKADILKILKSPEFFSDCFAILCLVLAVIVIFVILLMMHIIAPPALVIVFEKPALLLLIPPAAVVLTLTYGAFHLIFTALVHRDWDETRLHIEKDSSTDTKSNK